MPSDPLKRLIVLYLIKVKEVINRDGLIFVERDKNMEMLAKYGLTVDDAKDCILSLTPQNYYQGPLKDKDPNQSENIFIYLVNYKNIDIYIKLKIINNNETYKVKILSFHD